MKNIDGKVSLDGREKRDSIKENGFRWERKGIDTRESGPPEF